MRIGIIGAGHIGGTLARLLTRAGHEVAIANSRDPATLGPLVELLGPKARAGWVEDVARFGDAVVVAIPFGRYRELPAKALAGKIVIDANNYYPERDGHFEALDSGQSTSSELLQAHLRTSSVVKAFNTNFWRWLRDDGRPRGDPARVGVPIAGDNPDAKQVVATLIDQVGFDPVDAGPLAEGARRTQPGTRVYAEHLTRAELRSELGL